MAYILSRVPSDVEPRPLCLARTAVIMEHLKGHGRDLVDQMLRDRGAHVCTDETIIPASHRYILYIYPDIGPCPLLPNGWRALRWQFLCWYMNIAEVQAVTAAAMAIRGWDKLFLPLPPPEMMSLVGSCRPEMKAMSLLRERFCCIENQYLWLSEYDWFVPDQIDRDRYSKLSLRQQPLDGQDDVHFIWITFNTRPANPSKVKRKNLAIIDKDQREAEGDGTKRELRRQKRQRIREEGPIETVLADMRRERRAIAT